MHDAPCVIASEAKQSRKNAGALPTLDCFVRLAALGFLAMTVWHGRARIAHASALSPRDAQPGAKRANTERVGSMKPEYDFSRAERGKFYRAKIALAPPVHLDPNVAEWLTSHAEAKGTTLNELVNELLKKALELIEAAK
jgi:predicted HicB family RNase H-like nuclease